MPTSASEISIHSFLYIFGGNQRKIVRFFWILILVCSFSGFSFYFYVAYIKWHTLPDIVMDSREKNSRDFPFPAITICSPLFARANITHFLYIYKSAMLKEKNGSLSQSECEFYAANSCWCLPKYKVNYDLIRHICRSYRQGIDNMNIIDMLSESAPEEREFALNPNQHKLRRVFTADGICFTYNMQVRKFIKFRSLFLHLSHCLGFFHHFQ